MEIPVDRNLKLNEIDTLLDSLENKIKDAIDVAIPKPKRVNSIDKYSNSKITRLQNYKNKLLSHIHKLNRSFNTDSITQLRLKMFKIKIKHIRNLQAIEVQKSVNLYWKNRLKKLNPNNPQRMFPEINKLFKIRKVVGNIPSLEIATSNTVLLNASDVSLSSNTNDTIKITDPIKKLDILGAHFSLTNNQNQNLGNPIMNNIFNNKYKIIEEEIVSGRINNNTICNFQKNNPAHNPIKISVISHYFTNYNTVFKKFKFLNNKKSSGYDNIPNIALKHIPNNIIFYYTILFNNMLNYTYFPIKWKKAKVIAILKKDKKNSDPNSYRPISLLSNIGKVYERIINDIITAFCQEKNLIFENQYGFRKNHSTIHAINKLSSDINWALNERKCVGACLVDLEKAFDTVWLDGLIVKLKHKEFPMCLIKLI